MKKYLFNRSGLQLFAATAMAIKSEFPAIVVSCDGKVRYLPAGDTAELDVAPGAVVKKSGTLKLEGGASAVVYCNGRLKRLNNDGLHALPEVFKPGGLATLNFDPDFGKYIQAAVEFAAAKHFGDGWVAAVTDPKHFGDGWGAAVTDPKQGGDGWGSAVTDPKQGGDGWGAAVTDPKQGGDGWGSAVTEPKQGGDGFGAAVTDPKQGGDGWGNQQARVTPVLPFGHLQAAPTPFSWLNPDAAQNLQLEILDPNNQVLHSIAAPEQPLSVDLGKLALAPGQKYTWRLRLQDAGGAVSDTRQFAILPAADQTAAAQRATRSSVYESGDAVLRGMMEAVALERAEWYAAADQMYAGLINQHPGHNMLRMMYAAFSMRYGLGGKAKELLAGG